MDVGEMQKKHEDRQQEKKNYEENRKTIKEECGGVVRRGRRMTARR